MEWLLLEKLVITLTYTGMNFSDAKDMCQKSLNVRIVS